MKHTLAYLTATTFLAMGAAAFAADATATGESKVEYKKDGGYEAKQSSERTGTDGTTHSSEAKVDVDVDSKGRIDKTVKTESVTDPKGLFNAQKDTTKSSVEEKARGGYEKTTSSKHKDAAGTSTSEKSNVDVEVDAEGNVTETTKVEKVVDPKGLLNKEKTVSKTKVVNGEVVEEKIKTK